MIPQVKSAGAKRLCVFVGVLVLFGNLSSMIIGFEYSYNYDDEFEWLNFIGDAVAALFISIAACLVTFFAFWVAEGFKEDSQEKSRNPNQRPLTRSQKLATLIAVLTYISAVSTAFHLYIEDDLDFEGISLMLVFSVMPVISSVLSWWLVVASGWAVSSDKLNSGGGDS